MADTQEVQAADAIEAGIIDFESFPTGYEPAKNENNFMKLEAGTTRIRIIKFVITWQYWTEDQEGNIDCVRVPYNPKVKGYGKPTDTPNIRLDKNTGKPDKVKEVYEMIVWDYNTKAIKQLSISQVGIKQSLYNLATNPDWGKLNTYDVEITKKGEKLQTEYSVVAIPPKPFANPKVFEVAKEIDLNQVFYGEDPFKDVVMDFSTNDEEKDFEAE